MLILGGRCRYFKNITKGIKMVDEKKLIEEFERIVNLRVDVYGEEKENISFNYADLKNIINNQPKISDWIPCKDRLPEEKVNPITKDFCEYQVTFKSEDVTDIRQYKFGKSHWWSGPGIMDKYVIAWRQNIEPYHEP